jgi:sporulation protein YlmC with PRC-barrel domain
MSSARQFRKEEIVGKTVIETNGRVNGKVKDLLFTLDGAITLVVDREDGSELQVPMNKVLGVSDHVIVKGGDTMIGSVSSASRQEVSQAVSLAASSSAGIVCKYCGQPMAAGTVWCPSCGRSQG